MDFDPSEQPEIIDIWVVEERLGFGGMGAVYRCHNRDAPRIKAAIKVLANHLQASATVRKRFIREAELLFELEHPHIVKVRNIRMDATPPFIEMAFVDGVSLSRILKRGPLPPRNAARIIAQVASALAHCHARGVRHRDVKPANIIVRDGHATLVDFGVAINVQGTLSQGPRGGSLGTLSYTPPEWGGQLVEPTAWDAYAVGIVLYEALKGRMAFPVPDGLALRESVVQQIDVKRSTPHLDPGPSVPEELRELCRHLTMFDPGARTKDMGAVADTLTRWLAGESSAVGSVGSSVQASDPSELNGGSKFEDAGPPTAVDAGSVTVRAADAGITWAHITDDLGQIIKDDVPAAEAPQRDEADPAPKSGRPGPALIGPVGMAVVLIGAVVFVGQQMLEAALEAEPSATVMRVPSRPVRAVQFLRPKQTPDLPYQILFEDQDVTADVVSGTSRTVQTSLYDVEVRVGPDCEEGPGPNCLVKRWPVRVKAGSDAQQLHLEWPSLPPVPLVWSSEPPAGARVQVDGGPWMPASDLKTLPGGPVQLVLQHGACPKADACGKDCPAGCREDSLAMTLPLDPLEPVVIPLALPELPSPQKTRARRGAPVRNDQLARWLAAHPEYGQTNAAQVSGKNPDQYLRNWTDNQPPAGKEGEPAEHVTPELAMRYCASVGGRLPMIDAEPQTWNDKEAPFEYRINAQGLVTLLESSGRRLGKPAPKRTATFVRIVCVQ